MYDECKGQHSNCDICDGMRHDPHTGWFGFHDHYAGKDFNSEEEQRKYYKSRRDHGLSIGGDGEE